jgi:hypothetical protein
MNSLSPFASRRFSSESVSLICRIAPELTTMMRDDEAVT